MKPILVILFLIISRLSFAQNPPIQVGGEKQLFIDNVFIAQSENITLTPNPPARRNPVITYDKPWERGGFIWGTVLADKEKFKMWYRSFIPGKDTQYGKMFLCYAESNDGITWSKPSLNLVEFNGSKANNILPVEFEDDGAVFYDPLAPGQSRFKFLVSNNGRFDKTNPGVFIYESADGIHFIKNPIRLLDLMADTHNQVFYDTRLKKYVVYVRSWNKRSSLMYGYGSSQRLRTVSRIETDNILEPWQYEKAADPFYNWGKDVNPAISTEMPIVMSSDETDPPETDIYNPCVVQYPWAEKAYFAFPSIYRHFPPAPGLFGYNDGLLDIQLAVSRDGVKWNRFRMPYIGLNLETKAQYMGIGMLKRGSEIYQYYFGRNYTHGKNFGPQIPPNLSSIYCAVQRLDGFVSADAAYTGGYIITPSLVFEGNVLELNINTSAAGHALVEILNENGEPVDGYTLQDADPIQGNFINKKVSWKNNTGIGGLSGKPIKLHILMRAAKLYAFQFKNE